MWFDAEPAFQILLWRDELRPPNIMSKVAHFEINIKHRSHGSISHRFASQVSGPRERDIYVKKWTTS